MPARQLHHGSLFSGVGGFDLGLAQAGIKTVWMVETEPFCRAVLKTRFPEAELFGNIRGCGSRNLKPVDVITGGFPCQDVSVAGKRRGLHGERTGLFFEFARIAAELRPPWIVVENVPGLLSSRRGRDFAVVLHELAGIGYSLAYRILDSRFFGVAQRRRRVFIVGNLGEIDAAQVLFEPQGGTGNPAAGREAWTDIANSLTEGSGRVGSRGCDDGANIVASALRESDGHHGRSSPRGDGCDNHGWDAGGPKDGHLVVARPLRSGRTIEDSGEDEGNIVATLNSGGNEGGFRTEPGEHIVIQDVRGGTRDRVDHGQGIGIHEGGPCYSLSETERHAVAFTLPSEHRGQGNAWNTNYQPVAQTIRTNPYNNSDPGTETKALIVSPPLNMMVRRLTPTECECLQAFPIITDCIIMKVWSDFPKNSALVEIRNLRLRKSACNAEEKGTREAVLSVEKCFLRSQVIQKDVVHANVHIGLGVNGLVLQTQERLFSVASIAENLASYRHPIKIESFARACARLVTIAVHAIRLGVEELPRKGLGSITPLHGQEQEILFGKEMMRNVAGAGNALSMTGDQHTKSIILSHLNESNIKLKLATLCSYVAIATSGFIPEKISKENFWTLTIHHSSGWTIPSHDLWKYEDDLEFPMLPKGLDSARYRALGNACTVSVCKWIGERILKYHESDENGE